MSIDPSTRYAVRGPRADSRPIGQPFTAPGETVGVDRVNRVDRVPVEPGKAGPRSELAGNRVVMHFYPPVQFFSSRGTAISKRIYGSLREVE